MGISRGVPNFTESKGSSARTWATNGKWGRMTNYYPALARAVSGATRSADERRVVYQRAHRALLEQLREARPPVSELHILHELECLDEAIRKTEAAIRRSGLRRVTVQSEIAKELPRELVDVRSPESQRSTPPPSFLAQRNTLDRQPFLHRVPRRNWLRLGIILFAGFMLAVVAMMLKMHLQA
jgi:hypothetical protein